MALIYSEAVRNLLGEFVSNTWFSETFWPENEVRVALMMQIAKKHSITGRVLEVGCGFGFVAYLFSACGFEVWATDAFDNGERDRLFEKLGISYQTTNLNDPVPLSDYATDSFDFVLLGEVFEHILNHPAGLLTSIQRILCPGGLLVLTTPNPSTLANAWRVLRDTHLLWGTSEFLREVKFDHDSIIDKGEIHYREYPAWVVRDLLQQIGFVVGGIRYIRTGIAPSQSSQKRIAKRALALCGLADKRIFASGYVIWASKHNQGNRNLQTLALRTSE